MQTIKVTNTRRNIGGTKGVIWCNTIRAGRKIVAEIFEPCHLWPGQYQIEVKVAPGYMLKSTAATMPDAVLEFDRLTDSKYIFA